MKWDDTTGYSQREERIPTCWTANVGDLRLTVMNSHVYYKGTWIARCEPFFRETVLNVETAEAAQTKAIELLRARLERSIAALPSHSRQDAEG